MSDVDGGLRRMFRTRVPGHWLSVESGSTSGGIPDANFCLDGVEGWCEFKMTRAWAVKFRATQVPVISNRVRAGGRVWIPVRRLPKHSDIDELWLFPGSQVRLLAAGGLHSATVGWYYQGGPEVWDWREIRRVMRGEES